jgi:hypothetical protein
MNDSLNSEEMERQLEAEMEAMEYNPDSPDEEPYEMSAYNPDFMQSQTSFASIMSGATNMTQNQKALKKLVRK